MGRPWTAALLLATMPSAYAFTLVGSDWTWQNTPMDEPWELNTSSFPASVGTETDLEDAWLDSLDAWNDASSVWFTYDHAGRTTATVNLAGFDGERIAQYDAVGPGAAIAQAVVWSGYGDIIDCDILFYGANSYDSWDFHTGVGDAPVGAHDFRLIATHELGHCLGLGHSYDTGAVMFATTATGQPATDRELDSDDVDGFQALYAGYAEASLDLVDWTVDDFGDPNPGDELELTFSVDNLAAAPALDAAVQVSTGWTELTVTQPIALPVGDPDQPPNSNVLYGTVFVEVSSDCTMVGDVPITITLSAANAPDVVVQEVLPVVCAEEVDPTADTGPAGDTGLPWASTGGTGVLLADDTGETGPSAETGDTGVETGDTGAETGDTGAETEGPSTEDPSDTDPGTEVGTEGGPPSASSLAGEGGGCGCESARAVGSLSLLRRRR